MTNKQIFILTNFSGFLKSYSPIIVVGEQIRMLKRGGYDPVLITSKGWNPPEGTIFSEVKTERVEQVSVSNEAKVDATFEPDVEKLYEDFKRIIPTGSTVITHDLIFLPDYVKHNVACRKLAKEDKTINWIHWIHSATSPRSLIQERNMYGDKYVELLASKFPNSIVAFPNSYDIPRVAKNFNYELDEVVEVPHATNPVEGMNAIVQRLYDAHKLWEPEMIMVYPLRLDRGKNAEMNVRILAGARRSGILMKLIFCDFQSTGDDKVVYREDLKKLAKELGVEDEVVFLSEFDEAARMEVSHEVVLDLFTLSNVFCLPSKSETYSLVAQEAMLKGNICVLNHDFAPMQSIYGKIPIYRQFSSNIGFDGQDGEITTTYGDTDAYMADIAKALIYFVRNERGIAGKTWVRTQRNHDYIFKRYLEPLLHRELS